MGRKCFWDRCQDWSPTDNQGRLSAGGEQCRRRAGCWLILFIYLFERERKREWVEGKRERRERILSRLPTEHGAPCKAPSHDPEITT